MLLPIVLIVLLTTIFYFFLMAKAKKRTVFREGPKPKGTIEILPAEDPEEPSPLGRPIEEKFGKDKFKKL